MAVSWSRGGEAVTARVAPNANEKGTTGGPVEPGERAGDASLEREGKWIWKVGEGAAAEAGDVVTPFEV